MVSPGFRSPLLSGVPSRLSFYCWAIFLGKKSIDGVMINYISDIQNGELVLLQNSLPDQV